MDIVDYHHLANTHARGLVVDVVAERATGPIHRRILWVGRIALDKVVPARMAKVVAGSHQANLPAVHTRLNEERLWARRYLRRMGARSEVLASVKVERLRDLQVDDETGNDLELCEKKKGCSDQSRARC